MARLQEDVRRLRFWRGIIAELLGSLFVVFVGCAAFTVTYDEHSLAVKVGLAFGLTYAAVFYCMRHVGNGHLNPAVTVAMLLTRRASVIRCLLFIVSQFLGALIGAGLAVAVTASQLRTSDGNASSRYVWFGGCTVLGHGVSESQAFGVEFLATFLVVFVVFSCYEKTKYDHQSQAAPFVMGLAYAAVIMVTMPYTGGSVNTARSFGAAIVNNIWTDHWVFWFGPLLGGACGGATFDVIFSTKSSFTRIRNCFTVFHRRDDDTGSEMGDKGHAEAYHDEPAEGEEVGEPRKDGTAPTDELEVLNEKKDQPPSQHKPRLKLLRPKFACCSRQEDPRDEVAAGGTAPADDTEREPEAKEQSEQSEQTEQ